MMHQDHINLIRKAITHTGGIWADFGSGDGAFTLALRDLAGSNVEIYSIDKDNRRLQAQEKIFGQMFEKSNVHFLHADFTISLDLPVVDGILMANSLHYVKEQVLFLRSIRRYLKPKGKLVLVEYNVDNGNIWVPYPLSFHMFQNVAKEAGFIQPKLLSTIPSQFLNEIYAAETSLR